MDQLAHKVGASVEQFVRDALEAAAKIPGSRHIGRYISKSHQNDPARTVFEILLFLFALRYFFASKQSYSKRDYIKLSDSEVDELISEWEPEPLVKPLSADEKMLLSEVSVLSSSAEAPYAQIDGVDKPLLNLSSTDVYDVSRDPHIKEVAVEKLRYYGVGSCGPAGFYGNEDVHIECEGSLAKFLGTESAILYSQGLSTAASVIPCFAKRGDILVVDDAVSMPIQRGLQLSRAKVFYYAHNDMEDLEKQLVKSLTIPNGAAKVPRRFIVTEGLFEYTGNSPDLAKIISFKHKYKFRVILDESWSLGILGRTGKGLCEEQGVDRQEVDVTIGSLATALGMYGGFCAGSKAVVEHQRIISLAYTFSATEPPYLAGCTTELVNQMNEGKFVTRIASLREKAQSFTGVLQKCDAIDLISRPDSPIVIFGINGGDKIDDDDAAVSQLLHKVVVSSRKNGLFVSRLGQIGEWETFGPVNAIKVYLPDSLKPSEVRKTADTLVKSVKQALADKSDA